MSNLDLEKIIFPNDNNTYIIRDAQAHTDLANKADKDGSNIVGPWTMNITGHASQDIASTEKRQPGGVAELDQNAKIITSQLPSSVDEIIEGYYFNNKFYEDAQHTKEITGEASKIYIDLSSNQTYRWSGSTYVEISPSIALGVEHSTAGYGDWTNTAYLHATDANKISAAVASGLYKIAATSEGHIASLTAVTKADITALGIPAQDTTYSQGTGISIDNNNVINHSNSVTAGTAKGDDSKTLTFGGTFTIPSVTYDAQGHITTKGTTTMTMPGNPNTDRYVNSASFAHDSTNDNVKMTLTRAGSDTATVTANIPKVSSSSAGVAPKGASVSSQSQNTKFLREDGTWAKPSYTTNTNTTYTLGTSGNTVTLTPSSGSVQSITVPFATNSTKATQDASGNTITTTYRRLDNNTFDTISVTDLTAGDVVVTGVGRFTNGLYGNLTGNAATATKATQDGNGNVITSSYTPYKGDMKTAIGQNTPAAATKTYWESNTNIPTTSVNTAYNTSGTEYTLLFSKGGTNNYGSILRWGYSTPYLEILRRFQGNWQSSDWEKISAGYADTAGTATKLGSSNVGSATQPIYLSGGTATACTYSLNKTVPSDAVFTDTKNTAGSTDTSSKIFLIGATSQAANPQTYSQDTAYVGTDGCLYSGGSKVLTAHQDISGKVSKTGDTMSGALTVEASNSYSSYNEGIRINAGARTYATLLMGGTAGTTSGTNDGAFWLGVYNTGTTARRLMIAHNGSTTTGTYFYADSSSQISPALHLGAKLHLDYATTATMDTTSTNPQIVFSETGGIQAVKIIYSDWDSYRAPYGLKVVGDGSEASGAWFEVEGIIYGNKTINAVGGVNANTANSGTAGGLALWGTDPTNYGIAMRNTSSQGKFGGVQSDYAIYNIMHDSGTHRGWIWRRRESSTFTNVASIDCVGNAVFGGYVGIGGNVTNTSGVRAQYNSTTKSLDFVFVT